MPAGPASGKIHNRAAGILPAVLISRAFQEVSSADETSAAR
jgi:hypothetical protein